jgi:phosphatidylinositol alpha-mannosyltransferase
VRIALVCPYDWSVPGGVQSHVGGLDAALRRRGVDVEIVAPYGGAPSGRGVLRAGRPIPVPDNGSLARVALGPASIARVRRLVRSRGYDLLHLHEPLVPAVCLTALFAARVPVVGTFHRYGPGPGWYARFAPICGRAMARLDARIAVSRAAADHVSLTFPGPFRVIPNGIDVAGFAGDGERNGTRVLFIGRPEARKGLAVLLRALSHLGGETTLDLVGTGPEHLSLLAPAVPNGVLRRVRAHGWVSDEERRRLLARADVLCAPSLRGESFGLVLAEGMAAGVPVVASAIPGYVDVLPEDCGRLVPPGDERALAAAVEELLGDPGGRERMGTAGRHAARRFDWSYVVEEVLEVYAAVGVRAP